MYIEAIVRYQVYYHQSVQSPQLYKNMHLTGFFEKASWEKNFFQLGNFRVGWCEMTTMLCVQVLIESQQTFTERHYIDLFVRFLKYSEKLITHERYGSPLY